MKQHIKTHRIELLADGGKAARDMDYGSDAPEDDMREMGPLKNLPTFLEHPERGLNMTQWAADVCVDVGARWRYGDLGLEREDYFICLHTKSGALKKTLSDEQSGAPASG